ncbi:uncharacterized protein TNCT_332561 [Trichonephila clavata]|uniref:Methyltransferase type 11 domain-containing protein n=1 Tax=Trichonephila clavata TaxID=2740835 RepID=A0A8X6FKB5_TRICU|nr:uncharacterized protein TNCT_332561 [Trichonephila clavata]
MNLHTKQNRYRTQSTWLGAAIHRIHQTWPLPTTICFHRLDTHWLSSFSIPKKSEIGCLVGLLPKKSEIGCLVGLPQKTNISIGVVSTNCRKAECLPVGDETVCLLTAGTCFHWLDITAFFTEAKRVLVQGGVLAVYSSCAIHPVTGDEEKDYQLRMITNKFLYDDLKQYRSPRVQQAFEQYGNVEFPFEDVMRSRNVGHTYVASAADAVGYIRSMSTFQNFRAAYPLRADQLLHDYQDSIMKILNATTKPESTPLAYRRDYFLILCRKGKKRNKKFEN